MDPLYEVGDEPYGVTTPFYSLMNDTHDISDDEIEANDDGNATKSTVMEEEDEEEEDGEEENQSECSTPRYSNGKEALQAIYDAISSDTNTQEGSLDPLSGAQLGEGLLFLAKHGTVEELETGLYLAGSAHHCQWAIQQVSGAVLSELALRLDEKGMLRLFLTVFLETQVSTSKVATLTNLVEPLLSLAHRDPQNTMWMEGFLMIMSLSHDILEEDIPTRRIMQVITPKLESDKVADQDIATYILQRLQEIDPCFHECIYQMTKENQRMITELFLKCRKQKDLSSLPTETSSKYSFVCLDANRRLLRQDRIDSIDDPPREDNTSEPFNASQTETAQTNAARRDSEVSYHGESSVDETMLPGLFPKRISKLLQEMCKFINENSNDKDSLCRDHPGEEKVEQTIIALEEILSILSAPSPPPASEVAMAIRWTVNACSTLMRCLFSFKIAFLTLQVIEALANLEIPEFYHCASSLVWSMFRRLGDPKIVFRHANLKACGILAPMLGVDSLSYIQSTIRSKSKLTRESCAKLLTLMVLKACPSKQFIVDHQSKVLEIIKPLFEDSNSKVAAAANDFVAAFHQVLWLLSEEYHIRKSRSDDNSFLPPSRKHTDSFMDVLQQVLGINRSSEMSKVLLRRLADASTSVPSISYKGFLELVPPQEMHKRALEGWRRSDRREKFFSDSNSQQSYDSSPDQRHGKWTQDRSPAKSDRFNPPHLAIQGSSNFNENSSMESPVSTVGRPRVNTNLADDSSFEESSMEYNAAHSGKVSPHPIHIGEQEHLQQEHYERVLFGDKYAGRNDGGAPSGFSPRSSPPHSSNTNGSFTEQYSGFSYDSPPKPSQEESPSSSTPLWLRDDYDTAQTGTTAASSKRMNDPESSDGHNDETSKAAAMRARLTTIKRRSQSRSRRVCSATARSQGIFGGDNANPEKPDFISPIEAPQAANQKDGTGIYAKARFRSAGAGRFGRQVTSTGQGWVDEDSADIQASGSGPVGKSFTPSSKEYSRRNKGVSEYGGRDRQSYVRAAQRANSRKRLGYSQIQPSPLDTNVSSETVTEIHPPELSVVSAVSSQQGSDIHENGEEYQDSSEAPNQTSAAPLGSRRHSQLRRKMSERARTSTNRISGPTDGQPTPQSQSPSHEIGGFSGAEQMYIPTEDLTPCKDAESAVEKVHGKIQKTLEWEDQFNVLNTLRRLALFNSEAVTPYLHEFVNFMASAVDNLRSSVSKNALMTYSDFFMGMNKSMDSELDTVVPVLLRKCADTAAFIIVEAENALRAMCKHCTPLKSLTALLAAADHKNASVRGKASLWLEKWTEIHSGQEGVSNKLDSLKGKHTDRLLAIGAKFVQAGNEEARHSAKRMLLRLQDHGLVQRSSIDRVAGKRRDAEAVHRLLEKGMSDVVAHSPMISTPSRSHSVGRKGRAFSGDQKSGDALTGPSSVGIRPRRESSATRNRSRPPHPERARFQ